MLQVCPAAWPIRVLGANVGVTQANDFSRPTDEYGQPGGDHATSRTDPDDVERLTGIYGPDARRRPRRRVILLLSRGRW